MNYQTPASGGRRKAPDGSYLVWQDGGWVPEGTREIPHKVTWGSVVTGAPRVTPYIARVARVFDACGSVAEAARMLGIKEGSVRNALHKYRGATRQEETAS